MEMWKKVADRRTISFVILYKAKHSNWITDKASTVRNSLFVYEIPRTMGQFDRQYFFLLLFKTTPFYCLGQLPIMQFYFVYLRGCVQNDIAIGSLSQPLISPNTSLWSSVFNFWPNPQEKLKSILDGPSIAIESKKEICKRENVAAVDGITSILWKTFRHAEWFICNVRPIFRIKIQSKCGGLCATRQG